MASQTFSIGEPLSLELRFINFVHVPEGEEPLLKTGFEEEQGVYVAPEWGEKGTPAHTGTLTVR